MQMVNLLALATSFFSNQFILPALLCYILTIAFVPASMKIAHVLHAVDMPGEIKIHKFATPRLGGVAIFASFTISMLFFPSFTVLMPIGGRVFIGSGLILIFSLGAIDDVRNLSAKTKLTFQFVSALLAVIGIALLFPMSRPYKYFGIYAFILVFTNSFNLIDGMDGLAASLAMVMALAIGALASIVHDYFILFAAILIVSCSTGFLFYNLNPARVFLGDCGSTFVGFALATMLSMLWLHSAHRFSFLPLILLAGVPMFDTLLVIVTRIAGQKSLFVGDRNHSYDQLLQKGLTTFQTLVILCAISLVLAILGVFIYVRLI